MREAWKQFSNFRIGCWLIQKIMGRGCFVPARLWEASASGAGEGAGSTCVGWVAEGVHRDPSTPGNGRCPCSRLYNIVGRWGGFCHSSLGKTLRGCHGATRPPPPVPHLSKPAPQGRCCHQPTEPWAAVLEAGCHRRCSMHIAAQ